MVAGFSHCGTSAPFHEDTQHRVLSACLGVSIALHAVVLFALPGLRPSLSTGSSRPLTAILASTVEPEAEVAPTSPSRSRREVNLDTPGPILSTSEAAVDASRQAEPIPLVAPTPHIASAAPSGGDATHMPETPAASRSAGKSSAETTKTDSLEKYRLTLIDAVKRFKRYPIHAMEKGWQGRVEIRLVIGPNGTIMSTIIKRSSNYQILDDQALDMVKKGTGREPIPSALRGREFSLDIPVIFELQPG
jgi:protein TonB